MGYPPNLMLGVGHDIGGLLLTVYLSGGVLAEIHAPDELPDHHEVNALGRDIRAQGAGRGQVREHPGGPDVGVQPHGAPELQQAPLRPLVGGLVIPLGAAHGAQQHAVGLHASLQAGVRQGHAEGVDGIAAHGGVLIGKGVAEFGGHGVQHGHGFGHDLGADAVALDDGNRLIHARASFAFREAIRPPLVIMSLMKGGNGSAW